MAPSRNSRSYKINPVEVAIFSIVTLIFFNSIYNLFYDHKGIGPTALAPFTGSATGESRAPAAASQSFQNIEIRCAATADQEVNAAKVRLAGPLCDPKHVAEAKSESSKLLKTQVLNMTNKFSATVFTDLSSDRFSTDYIPLNPGKNTIQLEFTFEGGKTFTQTLSVQKN